MIRQLFYALLLAPFVDSALAQKYMDQCPAGTAKVVQVNYLPITDLDSLSLAPPPYHSLTILGALYLYDRDNGIENYPGISGVCESQGPGHKLLGQFYNAFGADPTTLQPGFSAALCCGIPPDPCPDGTGGGGGGSGRCGPNGKLLTSQTISLPYPHVDDCSQADAFLSQSELMRDFREVYLQCQAPGGNRPQLAKTAKFLDLVSCVGGKGQAVNVTFNYCCSTPLPQQLNKRSR